jgi:hypothetical protein
MNDVMQSPLNALPTSPPVSISQKETRVTMINYRDSMTLLEEYTKNRSEEIQNVCQMDVEPRLPRDGEVGRAISRSSFVSVHAGNPPDDTGNRRLEPEAYLARGTHSESMFPKPNSTALCCLNRRHSNAKPKSLPTRARASMRF